MDNGVQLLALNPFCKGVFQSTHVPWNTLWEMHKEYKFLYRVIKEMEQGHEKPQMPDSIIETFIYR